MVARLLPRGRLDLLRQILLFCGAYWLYRLVRGQVDGRAAEAYENARRLIDAEQALGLFVEPAVHRFSEAHAWISDTASWLYVNSHFTVTTVALAYLYLRRNEHFYWVRNMFLVAMGLALVLYVLVPTAPPRFMPELGFSDPVADFTGVRPGEGHADLLYNPYAAIPSMHVAFALMLALPLRRLARRAWVRWAWTAYPALVSAVVVVTANHWWLDAALGAVVALVGAGAAQGVFARLRPDAWAFQRG